MAAAAVALGACGTGTDTAGRRASPPVADIPEPSPADAQPGRPPAEPPAAPPAAPEASVGVADAGIFPDLDDRVQIALPPGLDPARTRGVIDPGRALLVLYADDWPVKVYPLGTAGATAQPGATARLEVGGRALALRPGDAAELAPLLAPGGRADDGRVSVLPDGAAPAPGDADGDGIPDPVDVLLGARKAAANAAAYTEGYVRIGYPMGDVPRTMGVCTDVVVRAVRNAGVDIQAELHRDIGRSPRSYPMVKGRGNPHIDHRRVKTLVPYFTRRWEARSPAIDDPADPLRPGDVLLMDTFPSRSGPDHIGIVSDRLGPGGLPMVINNWTSGTVTADMDLLGWVPVTHRFRMRSRGPG